MWHITILGYDFFYLFYMFFIYAFIGWIYESTYVSIKKRMWVNRGFFNGPVIPIYGFGALIFYMVLWPYRDNKALTFFGGAVLATVLEYITSWLMEAVFHTKWWDYSNYRFNIHGRVCLQASILWGFLSVVMLNVIHPKIDHLINKIPRKKGEYIGFLISSVFLADFVVTIIGTVKFTRLLNRIHILRQELVEYISTSKLYEYKKETLEKLPMFRLFNIMKEYAASKDEIIKESKIYQSLVIKKNYIRILKAFPTMVAGKRTMALQDLREKVFRKANINVNDVKEKVKGKVKISALWQKGHLKSYFRKRGKGRK